MKKKIKFIKEYEKVILSLRAEKFTEKVMILCILSGVNARMFIEDR